MNMAVRGIYFCSFTN